MCSTIAYVDSTPFGSSVSISETISLVKIRVQNIRGKSDDSDRSHLSLTPEGMDCWQIPIPCLFYHWCWQWRRAKTPFWWSYHFTIVNVFSFTGVPFSWCWSQLCYLHQEWPREDTKPPLLMNVKLFSYLWYERNQTYKGLAEYRNLGFMSYNGRTCWFQDFWTLG